MSLNASTTSVIINSLTTGGLYTARVAGLTRVGLGPFSSPTLLNMDPGQLTQLPPRSMDPSHGAASVVRETWFLVMIITMIFAVIVALLAALYVRRRQAMSKQLGHLNVPVGTANDICQLNKDTLWLERGWRPTNTLQGTNDKDCETKLLNNQHMLAAGIMGMAGSEYAEVNLTTFYNTRKQMQAPPPEPYATTTLCVGSRNSDSIETTCQKSSSGDSCLKPDYSSLDSNQEPNKSTVSPCSDNTSGGDGYTDENLDMQRRQYRIAGPAASDAPSQTGPMPNWCDMLPPPPEHPPPLGIASMTAAGRMHQQQQQQQVPFSPHLGKRSVQNDLDHCGSAAGSTNSQSPPTPPIRVTNSFSPSPTPWSGSGQSQHSESGTLQILPGSLQVPQGRYTTLPPQTNPPPLPTFPQGFDHYDYRNQENEYESGSVIYGHHQNGLDDYGAREPVFTRAAQQSHLNHPSAMNEELYRHKDDMFHSDNLYQPENDEWDRKSCDSNTHSDACCSCSESSCLYADTMQYNAQQFNTACGHGGSSSSRTGSRSRSNRSPRRRNRTSSPTYSSDSNYSCIPQRQCSSTNSQERLRHNRSKGNNRWFA